MLEIVEHVCILMCYKIWWEVKCEALCQAILVNKNLSDPSGQVKLKAKYACDWIYMCVRMCVCF